MDYDLIIVGAGSGGYEAGLYALRRGLKVALVELSPETVGGNCLNKGCIPSKYMRHSAHTLLKMRKIRDWGIEVERVRVNYGLLKEGRDRVVRGIRESFLRYAKTLGIPLYFGRGVLEDENTVLVEGQDKRLKAKSIIVATGSSTSPLGELRANSKTIHDTDTIWDLEEIPESLLIVGGGASGCEFAFIFRMLGSKVYLVELKDRLLPSPSIPEDSSRYLSRKLKDLGVNIYLKTKVDRVEERQRSVRVYLSNGEVLEVDKVLLCVGRKPNTEGIGLESLGVSMDGRGFVKVDEFCRTNVKNIYACGDITSPLMLAHKSMIECKIAINHILGGKDWKRDERLIPKIVYSVLEVASVGLTEDEAEDLGYDVEVGTSSFSANPKAMDDGESEGFVKVVIDGESKRLLGCHIVGPCAGELIHQFIHLLKLGESSQTLSKSFFSHPSLSETLLYATLEAHYGPITFRRRR